MKCTVCNRQRNELKKKNSKCLPGTVMYLCTECLAGRKEPRGYVILAGRQHGIEHIEFWIKGHRYAGEPITARELS